MTSAALGTVGLLPSQDLPPPAPPTVLPPPHTLVAFPASREGLRVVRLPATPPLPWGSRLPASLSAWPLCRPATLPWTPPAAPFQRGAWPPVSPHCRPVAMLKQSDLLKVPASCVLSRDKIKQGGCKINTQKSTCFYMLGVSNLKMKLKQFHVQ